MPERVEKLGSRALFAVLTAVFLPQAAAARATIAQAPADPPCAACIALTVSAGQSVLADSPLNGIEILVRLPADPEVVASALENIRKAGGRPGLWVRGVDGWSSSHLANLPLATRLVFDLTSESSGVGELAFRLKSRLVEARGAAPGLRVGVVARPDQLTGDTGRDLTPYVDFHGTPTNEGPAFPPSARWSSHAAAIFATPANGREAPSASEWIVRLPEDAIAARALLRDLAASASLLTSALVPGGLADVRCGESRLPTYLDSETLVTIAIASGCAGSSLQFSPELPGITRIALSTGEVVVRVPSADGRFADHVQVVGERALGVREIIARHQAAAAGQRRAVRQLISTGAMTLSFEAPGFAAPLAISARTTIFTGPDRVEIEQRDVRVNGLAFHPDGRIPRLPLIEPERVVSPPLAITLTEVYRYRLDGEDAVGGTQCYVVSFEPFDSSRALFAGRAWIARDSFALVKVSAVQTGLRGPIVSSEQTDDFRPHGDAWLLSRSELRQVYEGPGHRTPIHRVHEVTTHEVNPAGFEARRAAAYAAPSVMLRDTPEGFRYLKRGPSADGQVTTAEPVVAGPATEVLSIALGVILDPNISRPLPFAGLSYVDFDLFGTGTQFNGFFGGTYGQLAVSVPSLGGTRWQLGARAFGIASSYNDREFEEGREIYPRNISQQPAHGSVWLLRPLTPRLTVRVGYDLDYTRYRRTESTAPTFLVPTAQVAHGLRLGIDGQWAGWNGSLWWAGVRRGAWRQWGELSGDGPTDGYQSNQHDFQRMGASLSRSFVASARLVGRVEAAWMSGKDLDRFSRYAFGSFDNRLRGYPSALVRYDRGGVVRTALAWTAGRLLRLDGFLDTAYVRDWGFGARLRPYTGVGAAAEVPLPLGTLAAIEWGYGFQGINADGREGTQVMRITTYKVF